MTAQLYLPYTYIIGWRKERKFYYGVRWANTCTPEDDLWNEYFTSSKSMVPLMRTLYGEPDLVKIHRTFSDKDEAILFEEQMLRRLNILNNFMWLNQSIKGAVVLNEKMKEKARKKKLGKRRGAFSNEHKRKISLANKGKICSKQTRQKISESLKGNGLGRKLSEETKRKISKAHKGKIISEETRQKISNSLKGKMVGKKNPMYDKSKSEKTKKKQSIGMTGKMTGVKNPFFGKTHTVESKNKMSEAHKGKKLSIKTRQKMSASSAAAKKVQIYDDVYNSINEAAKAHNVDRKTIYNWIKRGKATKL